MKNSNKIISLSYDCISKHRTMLMGLAILSIILFHYTEDCVDAGYNTSAFVTLYKNYIGSCGVDVFLFLSGLGLYYSFKKNASMKSFYFKRFTRILIPYFLVAIPTWSLIDISFLNLDFKQVIKDIFFISLFQNGTIKFWYILMMLVCYLIFPILFDYIDSPGSKNKMINIFIFITVIALLLQQCNYDFFNKINIALARFPAFFFGCFAGKAAYHKRPMRYEIIIMVLLSILLLPLKASSATPLSRYILGFFGITCFIILAILLELIHRSNFKIGVFQKIIEWFGNYSLELYLSHVAIRTFLFHLDLPPYHIRYEALLILLSIIASLAIKKCTNYIVKFISNKIKMD